VLNSVLPALPVPNGPFRREIEDEGDSWKRGEEARITTQYYKHARLFAFLVPFSHDNSAMPRGRLVPNQQASTFTPQEHEKSPKKDQPRIQIQRETDDRDIGTRWAFRSAVKLEVGELNSLGNLRSREAFSAFFFFWQPGCLWLACGVHFVFVAKTSFVFFTPLTLYRFCKFS
jgi:hypothetical protein